MNVILYNIAMDKIIMSDEHENRILENISESMVAAVKKKKHYIRFIFVIAAVFITGSIGAAAVYVGLDWLKEFFSNKIMR